MVRHPGRTATVAPAVAGAIDSAIGQRIRLLRETRRLPMAELAERIGKSIGFVSQVERGLSSLAVRELVQIAEVLGVDFLTLFAAPGSEAASSPIHRRGGSAAQVFHASGIHKLPLTPGNTGITRLFMMQLEPHASTGSELYSHDGEEAGLVVAGSIDLTIGAVCHRLQPGDSFRFASSMPHGFSNAGASPAEVLWVNVRS